MKKIRKKEKERILSIDATPKDNIIMSDIVNMQIRIAERQNKEVEKYIENHNYPSKNAFIVQTIDEHIRFGHKFEAVFEFLEGLPAAFGGITIDYLEEETSKEDKIVVQIRISKDLDNKIIQYCNDNNYESKTELYLEALETKLLFEDRFKDIYKIVRTLKDVFKKKKN